MVSGVDGTNGPPVHGRVVIERAQGQEHATRTGKVNTGKDAVEEPLKQFNVNRLYNVQVSKGLIVTTSLTNAVKGILVHARLRNF